MSGQVKAWLAVAACIVVVAAGLAYVKYAEIQTAIAAAQAFPEPSEAVEVAKVRRGEWSATSQAIGTVVAVRQVEMRNELAGTVAEVGFTSGQIVEAGQVLVRLDTRQERAELAASEAEARIAQLTLERRQSLSTTQTVSKADLDRAREDFAVANARVQGLRAEIAKKTLNAPFRARVGLTDLQPGSYLAAGSRVATLQGVDPDAYVDFSLPQDAAAQVREGVMVTLGGRQLPNGTAEAWVIADDAAVDGANRTVRFRAVAQGFGDSLRPGTFLDVVVQTSPPQQTLLVPLTAVRRSPYGQHVFLVVEKDGQMRAERRVVRTGPVVGDDIAIVDGLAEGDLIATAGSFKLREGLLVRTGEPAAAQPQPAAN
ncbi:MAG: efflux RND transporter periplasmic adaptor subunit [Alphaproteobacteria bacterium]